jgi:hypothetical protein
MDEFDMCVDGADKIERFRTEELRGMKAYQIEDFTLLKVLGRGGYGKVGPLPW